MPLWLPVTSTKPPSDLIKHQGEDPQLVSVVTAPLTSIISLAQHISSKALQVFERHWPIKHHNLYGRYRVLPQLEKLRKERLINLPKVRKKAYQRTKNEPRVMFLILEVALARFCSLYQGGSEATIPSPASFSFLLLCDSRTHFFFMLSHTLSFIHSHFI